MKNGFSRKEGLATTRDPNPDLRARERYIFNDLHSERGRATGSGERLTFL